VFVDVITVSALLYIIISLIAIKMTTKKLENNFLVSTLGKLLVFLINYAYYATFFCYEKVR
jgi:uncharacterized membrane protein YozB (DUF420 family)